MSAAKEREAFLAGKALVNCIEKNIRPRDIITRKSLENAYTFVLALGGSTNAVLHLMAIAREAGVKWTLDDFDRLGGEGAAPRGPEARRQARHVRPVPRRRHARCHESAARQGLLHGDCLTVTGNTIAENLKDVPSVFAKPQKVVHAVREADVRSRHHRRAAGQPRARRRGREGRRA